MCLYILVVDVDSGQERKKERKKERKVYPVQVIKGVFSKKRNKAILPD